MSRTTRQQWQELYSARGTNAVDQRPSRPKRYLQECRDDYYGYSARTNRQIRRHDKTKLRTQERLDIAERTADFLDEVARTAVRVTPEPFSTDSDVGRWIGLDNRYDGYGLDWDDPTFEPFDFYETCTCELCVPNYWRNA